jgi:hypothetical protein
VSVLVLEAGAANLNDLDISMMYCSNLLTLTHVVCAVIPGRYGNQLGKPQYDWGFFSVSVLRLIPSRSNLGQGAPSECKWEAYVLATVRSPTRSVSLAIYPIIEERAWEGPLQSIPASSTFHLLWI